MSRIASVILCLGLLAFTGLIASPANAGGRNDGYYGYVTDRPYRASNARYSSSCCYRKVVRHVRQVRYVRVQQRRVIRYRRNRDYGYYDRPRYRVSSYEQPRRRVNYYEQPRRYAEDGGYGVRRDRCRRHRVRVLGANGGWVWAVTARCY